ncbi:MAG TPA: 50S ribosomal protein L15 [Chitinophagaceae bacterium]|nr:50S ribosomal protein L15 [Chitinophagaceae bacterium]
MNLHNLQPAKGSVKKPKRLGRGEASGKGGTSTKGNKGHQSRSGFKNKKGHEGGQMPIQRRLPKRGFKNPGRQEYRIFNLGALELLAENYGLEEISQETLFSKGLIRKADKVKILAGGDLKRRLPFRINAISAAAKQAIEAAGGTVEILQDHSRPVPA